MRPVHEIEELGGASKRSVSGQPSTGKPRMTAMFQPIRACSTYWIIFGTSVELHFNTNKCFYGQKTLALYATVGVKLCTQPALLDTVREGKMYNRTNMHKYVKVLDTKVHDFGR